MGNDIREEFKKARNKSNHEHGHSDQQKKSWHQGKSSNNNKKGFYPSKNNHNSKRKGNNFKLLTPAERKKQREKEEKEDLLRRKAEEKKPYGDAISVTRSRKPAAIATAPYNFISLPHDTLRSPLNDYLDEMNPSKAMASYVKGNKTFSGKIQLDIKTITPIYINGNNNKIFAPAGVPIIPGSSLRGMIKNLFKMISFSKWKDNEDITNRHLYYRCLMATDDKTPFNYYLHEQYNDKMTSTKDGKIHKNPLPGFIVKRKNKWYIYSLMPNKLHSIPIYEFKNLFNLDFKKNFKKSCVRWTDKCAYIQTGIPNTKNVKKSKKELESATPKERKTWGKQYFKYMKFDEIDKSEKGCHLVPDEVIYSYQHDKNRHGINLLDRKTSQKSGAPKSINGLKPYDQIMPCFYLTDESGNIKSFGHGQSYRIPYDHAIMDAIPESLRDRANKHCIDFADAVFGHSATTSSEVSWASRVYFDDAQLVSSNGMEDPAEAHMLMQPNPTAFQLYLKQDQPDRLTDWNSSEGLNLRGYKMYWHNSPEHDWRANDDEKDNNKGRNGETLSLLKVIAPLKPGAIFKGQIRFHDLTEEELGALLKVFHIGTAGQDIAYKIGMGKSIGLGSVHINTKLMLEDGSRYQKLFDNEGWHNSQRETSPTTFINAYEVFLETQGEKFTQDYCHTLHEMQNMMDYNTTKINGWDKVTAAINGDTKKEHDNKDTRFADRNILPSIDEVLKKATMRNGDNRK